MELLIVGLGYFKDSVYNLEKAVEYLKYYNKKSGLIKEGAGL